VGAAAGQALCPAEHESPHTPPLQRWPAAQAMPHPPQFCGSVWVLVQKAAAPEPQALGVADGQAQALAEQACPAGQTLPQAPQLFGSVVVVAQ
jgi:hypothetical protein